MANSVKKYVFVIDPRRCIDCRACLVSCRAENDVPIPNTRIWVYDQGVIGEFPNLAQQFVPYNCMHCDEPPCVEACPSQATYKRKADGIVVIDQEACIGCGLCLPACPYHVRYLNPQTGKADKCNACLQRTEQGEAPACVATCVGGSRLFGDLTIRTAKSRSRCAMPRASRRCPPWAWTPARTFSTSTTRLTSRIAITAPRDSARRHVLSEDRHPRRHRRCRRDVPGSGRRLYQAAAKGESEFDE